MRLVPDYETNGFTWCDDGDDYELLNKQRHSVVASTIGFEPVSLGSSPSVSYYKGLVSLRLIPNQLA